MTICLKSCIQSMYHVRDRNVRYYAFTCYVTKACRTPLAYSDCRQPCSHLVVTPICLIIRDCHSMLRWISSRPQTLNLRPGNEATLVLRPFSQIFALVVVESNATIVFFEGPCLQFLSHSQFASVAYHQEHINSRGF